MQQLINFIISPLQRTMVRLILLHPLLRSLWRRKNKRILEKGSFVKACSFTSKIISEKPLLAQNLPKLSLLVMSSSITILGATSLKRPCISESVLGSKPELNEASIASYNVACCYSKLDQVHPGKNVGIDKDHTIFTLIDGLLKFEKFGPHRKKAI